MSDHGVKVDKRSAYTVFETPLGWCGIAWNECAGQPAVVALHLPEATRETTAAGIARSCSARPASVPPPEIAEIIARVRKHLAGELQDFRNIAIDLGEADGFARRVWEATREIPAGETRTYGELATVLRAPGAARAVGQALGRNPIALIIPCHRVLAANGHPGGFSAYGGRATKTRLLAIEGARSRLLNF